MKMAVDDVCAPCAGSLDCGRPQRGHVFQNFALFEPEVAQQMGMPSLIARLHQAVLLWPAQDAQMLATSPVGAWHAR